MIFLIPAYALSFNHCPGSGPLTIRLSVATGECPLSIEIIRSTQIVEDNLLIRGK